MGRHGIRRWHEELPVKALEKLGDWTSPAFRVEPAVEERLAALGVAGAQRTPLVFEQRR